MHMWTHACIPLCVHVCTHAYVCIPLIRPCMRLDCTCLCICENYVCVCVCEDGVWVGVPALCGALNRGPFVVDRERERERTSPGGCVETLGRAATPNSQAPPCGLRWHNHLAEIREPCPRAACYKRLLDARPGYNAMDQLAKSELTLWLSAIQRFGEEEREELEGGILSWVFGVGTWFSKILWLKEEDIEFYVDLHIGKYGGIVIWKR